MKNDPIIHAPLSKIVEVIRNEFEATFNGYENVVAPDLLIRIITTALASLGGEERIDLTDAELNELETLRSLQKDSTRVFSQEEYDRLKYLVWKQWNQPISPSHPSEREVLEDYLMYDNRVDKQGEPDKSTIIRMITSNIDRYLAEKGGEG